MIRINGFLHRDEFCELIRRWIFSRPDAADAAALLRLVHFNNVFVSRYLPRLAETVFETLHGGRPGSRRAHTKGDLKDRIVTSLPVRTPRLEQLVVDYHNYPGCYYRETPFHGTLYFGSYDDAEAYIGSSRIKRVRRLAEKSARRLVDWIHGEIHRLAVNTVREPGASSSAHDVDHRDSDLSCAEIQFLQQTGDHHQTGLTDTFEINDVSGIKVILDAGEEDRLIEVLRSQGCHLLEQERHTGDFEATNLIVDYPADRERILAQRLPQKIVSAFEAHGVAEDEANREFADFVQTGEDRVRVEIMVSSYAQMLESEIGRCMHEDRIIRQRQGAGYQGHLARNIEFLVEYLFMLPAAPGPFPRKLPIRLWDRYLPDYFDEVKRVLFHIPSVELDEL